MIDVRACLIAMVAILGLAGPALGFRNVAVDSPVPAVTLDGAGGRRVAVPAPGRPMVLLFWRPGQAFSEEALTDLEALAAALSAKGVTLTAVAETGSGAGRAPRPPLEAAADTNRQASDAFGVIVFPSTAVVDARGVLKAYLPSRNSNYRRLVETYTLRALGEISDADVTARLVSVGEVHGRDAEAAQTAYRQGTALASERRYEEAARELARALALQPDLTQAHLGLGYARLDMNEAAQALREFEFVLAKNPTSPGARVGVGIARIRLGRVDEGIRLLEEAVVLNPEPVRGYYELGRAYEARGDTARAVSHYRWAFLKLLQGRK